jgi:RNA polymerase primary sigma factor
MRTASLDRTITEDLALRDLVVDVRPSPETLAEAEFLRQEISDLLAGLDYREREVICLRYGLDRGTPRTLAEVAAHFGVTRERIRQVESKTLVKLRSLAGQMELRAFIDCWPKPPDVEPAEGDASADDLSTE